jgi:shikimate dehydrogenase
VSRRAAVLGSPITHSLSPVLHRAAYQALGLDWSYEAIECDEGGLAALLDRLDRPEKTYAGLSLTMPLKRAVLPLLDEVTPLAAAVGAANTVLFESGRAGSGRRGDNTDVAGICASVRQLRPAGVRSAAILGAGGTAAAALAAVRELGVSRPVTVAVRDPARAVDLEAAARRLGVDITVVRWPGAPACAEAELVISTVPAGATDSLAGAGAPLVTGGQLLFDVLYWPWPTPLASAAIAAGADVIGGLELLVQQAAVQVELMTGRAAPVDAMRAAGTAALASRSAPH